MNAKLFTLLLALMLLAVSASAQQSPNDEGAYDSMIFEWVHQPDVVNGDSTAIAEFYIFNDVDTLGSASIGLKWDFPSLIMDSAKMSPTADAAFDFLAVIYRNNLLDSTNFYQVFQFSGTRLFSDGLINSPTRQLAATYWFHVDAMTWSDTITVDSFQFSTGTNLTFVDNHSSPHVPYWENGAILLDVSDVTPNGQDNLPTEFALEQNYPNPFNPTTTIKFDVPVKSHVTLDVFNVLGQKVTTLVNEELPPQSYTKNWDGQSDGGNQVASGIYFYRLSAGDNVVLTKKMMLLK
ncbi:MAG: T9SS type A sorting domain-containing protein [bacterium]|nr:T9SS type A sorting domain-containing protein [bacterium]